MKFIRLGAILINPSSIRTITMTDTKYTIQFMSESVSGTCVLGSGMVTSSNRYIVIDKKENASDYRVLENWITKNENL
jgi:predicted transglutaminase-like protease